MKKFYLEPEVEIIESELEGFLCDSNGEAEGGGSDGGSDVNPTDPSDPGWGGDY